MNEKIKMNKNLKCEKYKCSIHFKGKNQMVTFSVEKVLINVTNRQLMRVGEKMFAAKSRKS